MNTLILDVGCSNTKYVLYTDGEMVQWWKHATPPIQNLAMFQELLKRYELIKVDYGVEKLLTISYSDSLFYQTVGGTIHHIGVFTDIEKHAHVPDYQIAGKPDNSELLGMAHQLLHLRDKVGLTDIKRILPPATMFASYLSGNHDWNTWDITHASNSGMWDYENADWCSEMEPFIDAGIIDAKVVKPKTPIDDTICVGGHDSVFVNANDTPYSTKPYLSLGTWVTASVEKPFRKRDRNSLTRFVVAPNSTTLEQICINAENANKEFLSRLITGFFECRLPKDQNPPSIQVFGGWSEDFDAWQSDYLEFQIQNNDDYFLHKQAARYVS